MIVAIPTIGKSSLLRPLLEDLMSDPAVAEVILYVNQPDVHLDIPPFSKIYTKQVPERSIYHSWNKAISYAAYQGDYLAILNDDIRFTCHHPMTYATEIMDEHQEVTVLGFNYTGNAGRHLYYTHGSYRHGGIGGFAFCVSPAHTDLVDTGFEWWGGDDDLFFSAEKNYGAQACAIAGNLTVEHPLPETSAVTQEWTNEAKGRDMKYLAEKWGM